MVSVMCANQYCECVQASIPLSTVISFIILPRAPVKVANVIIHVCLIQTNYMDYAGILSVYCSRIIK